MSGAEASRGFTVGWGERVSGRSSSSDVCGVGAGLLTGEKMVGCQPRVGCQVSV